MYIETTSPPTTIMERQAPDLCVENDPNNKLICVIENNHLKIIVDGVTIGDYPVSGSFINPSYNDPVLGGGFYTTDEVTEAFTKFVNESELLSDINNNTLETAAHAASATATFDSNLNSETTGTQQTNNENEDASSNINFDYKNIIIGGIYLIFGSLFVFSIKKSGGTNSITGKLYTGEGNPLAQGHQQADDWMREKPKPKKMQATTSNGSAEEDLNWQWARRSRIEEEQQNIIQQLRQIAENSGFELNIRQDFENIVNDFNRFKGLTEEAAIVISNVLGWQEKDLQSGVDGTTSSIEHLNDIIDKVKGAGNLANAYGKTIKHLEKNRPKMVTNSTTYIEESVPFEHGGPGPTGFVDPNVSALYRNAKLEKNLNEGFETIIDKDGNQIDIKTS